MQHKADAVLGRTKAKTLFLRTDTRGLGAEILPPDTQLGRDAVESIRRGDLDGMSFGFRVPDGGDRWSVVDGWDYRELIDVDLIEVSVVTFPQYTGTSAQVQVGSTSGRSAPVTTKPDWRIKAEQRERLLLLQAKR